MSAILDKFVGLADTMPPEGHGWQGRSVGGRYWQSFRTLAEAKADEEGYVVLDSAYGNLILLLAPAYQVQCSEETLVRLLHDLQVVHFHAATFTPFRGFDNGPIDWDATFADADIRYERYGLGDYVGGAIRHYVQAGTDMVLHREFLNLGLEPQVEAILAGKRQRIQWKSSRRPKKGLMVRLMAWLASRLWEGRQNNG